MPERPTSEIIAALLFVALQMAGPKAGSGQPAPNVQVSGGLGVTLVPRRDELGRGGGLQAEYLAGSRGWADARLYAGGFVSSTSPESCVPDNDPCSVSSAIGVAGGKGRVVLPIPFVGPFLELGVGLSVGSIETRIGSHGFVPAIDSEHSGLMLHVPVGLGLAFGAQYQHDLALNYFFHPGRENVPAVVSVGIGFEWC